MVIFYVECYVCVVLNYSCQESLKKVSTLKSLKITKFSVLDVLSYKGHASLLRMYLTTGVSQAPYVLAPFITDGLKYVNAYCANIHGPLHMFLLGTALYRTHV